MLSASASVYSSGCRLRFLMLGLTASSASIKRMRRTFTASETFSQRCPARFIASSKSLKYLLQPAFHPVVGFLAAPLVAALKEIPVKVVRCAEALINRPQFVQGALGRFHRENIVLIRRFDQQ